MRTLLLSLALLALVVPRSAADPASDLAAAVDALRRQNALPPPQRPLVGESLTLPGGAPNSCPCVAGGPCYCGPNCTCGAAAKTLTVTAPRVCPPGTVCAPGQPCRPATAADTVPVSYPTYTAPVGIPQDVQGLAAPAGFAPATAWQPDGNGGFVRTVTPTQPAMLPAAPPVPVGLPATYYAPPPVYVSPYYAPAPVSYAAPVYSAPAYYAPGVVHTGYRWQPAILPRNRGYVPTFAPAAVPVAPAATFVPSVGYSVRGYGGVSVASAGVCST